METTDIQDVPQDGLKVHYPQKCNVGGKQVVFGESTTQEEREKVVWHYALEKAEKVIKARKHPLFQEIKTILKLMEKDIYQDPDNAHLRGTRRSVE